MNVLIIIKDGPLVNQTLSTVKFDQHGTPVNKQFIVCDTWTEGFLKAKVLRYQFGLFVDSGTIFDDIVKFIDKIAKYPHQGLIGHIVDPLNADKFFYLNEQCFFLDLEKFTVDDFAISDFVTSFPQRSDRNIHANYTPLWLKPSEEKEQIWVGTSFGEKILAKQLGTSIAVNWNNEFRNNKRFLYTDEDINDWLNQQNDYISIAENQLWVFNNEPIPAADEKIILAPASGLFWIKNIVGTVDKIHLVDISNVQLKLAKQLWESWDGTNYGQFVYDFIKDSQIVHFNLDQPTMSNLDRIKLKSSKIFVSTVNEIFSQQMIDIENFTDAWQQAKSEKQITFNLDDMVKFLPGYVESADDDFNLWLSNILDYKYTLIKNTKQEYDRFTFALNNAKIKRIHG